MPRPLLALLLSASLCAAASAQTLVVADTALPTSLDSVDARGAHSLVVTTQITETLVAYAPGSTVLIPRLATGWSTNPDATVWTLTLREGVRFHDGTPFDAAAVKFNFDRWNDSDHPYAFRGAGKTYVPWGWIFGGPRGQGGILDRVVVAGSHTVSLHTTSPTPFLPSLLASPFIQFDSPAAVIAAGVAYGTVAVGSVGTGPFRFDAWIEGEQVSLVANPDYWDGPPALERVVFRPIREATNRYLELRAGTVDVAVQLAADDYAAVLRDPRLQAVLSTGELSVGGLAIHQGYPPLDDVRVRRAIAHAIDREAIVAAFFGELAAVANAHVAPGLLGYAASWPYDYDPERARALLAEAGYPGGFEIDLWYRASANASFPDPRAIAEAWATYLADVGIRARLATEDHAAYLTRSIAGGYALYQFGWTGDYADPDAFLATFFGDTVGRHGVRLPQLDDLLARSRQEVDSAARAAILDELRALVEAEVLSVPTTNPIPFHATSVGITGWVMSPLGYYSVPLHRVSKR
jgi:peptide/nickel transport system substrate-binding protein